MAGKENLARALRKRSTDAEKLLWQHLRNRAFQGIKFRRQHPFGPYIVDFISLERNLIIELDGGQHGQQENRARDEIRDSYFRGKGYKVLRFWNNDIFTNLEGVLEAIRINLET